jgi:hypothetical protein
MIILATLATLKKILFWSYDRGTWQYDLMCVLILAFIFFTPNSLFQARTSPRTVRISTHEVGQFAPDQLDLLTDRISKKLGRKVNSSQIELILDRSGKVTGYLLSEE